MKVGQAEFQKGSAHTEDREMNGIMQEQKTLQVSHNRQRLATAPPWFAQNTTANEHAIGQIFLDTRPLEGEFAAEREHEHWGLNE